MIDAVIVTYNSARDVEGALGPLGPLVAAGEATATVVDNASSDGTADLVRGQFPWARLLALPENLGFAAATNAGIAGGTGDHVLLLNPDVRFDAESLKLVEETLEVHPGAGIAAPVLLNADGTLQASGLRFPGALAFLLSRLPGFGWIERVGPRPAPYPAGWTYGAFLLVRRSLIDRIGPLDEGYFLYGEEKDFCRRSLEVGAGLIMVPSARVIHLGGGSTGRWNPVAEASYVAGQWRYFRRHEGRLARWYGFCVGLRLLLRGVANLAPGRGGEGRRETDRAALAAWIKGWRGEGA